MTLSNLRQALLLNNAKILKLIKELENDSSTNLSELQNILNSHLENNVIHVTQNDKDVWNSTLQNAKDYAQSLFDGLIGFKIVSELPTNDILEKVIYLVPNGNEESDNNYYDEYMYIDSKWEIIGNTLIKGEPGKDATINGVNTLTIVQGKNIILEQEGNVLTISSTGNGGTNYIAGNGINISNDTISVKISKKEDNATGVLDNEIYTPIVKPTNLYPLINVNITPAISGITVKATKGISEISGITDENGKVSLSLDSFGVWTISATIEEDTVEKNIAIGEIKEYNISLSNVNVFGVAWDTTNPSTQLTRLTPDTDPYNIVTQAITQEPMPALGVGSGSSPFDDFMPWKGMEEYNIIDGVVSYKKGEPNFSRTSYDTMVYIPPFYYRRELQNNIQYFYIGDKMFEGAELHPGSGKYIGKYLSSTDAVSKSGLLPQGNMSLQTALTTCSARGENYSVYGYPTYCAIVLLYLIEFANLNSQQMMGNDIVSDNLQNSGQTDIMNYHTGNTNVGEYISAVQYRGIENPYGNLLQYLGGFIISADNKIYICIDSQNFNGSITENYQNTNISIQLTGAVYTFGNILNFNSLSSWVIIPSNNQGSSSTYLSDAYFYNTNGVPVVGGTYILSSEGASLNAGMFFQNIYWNSSYSHPGFGYRLQFNP